MDPPPAAPGRHDAEGDSDAGSGGGAWQWGRGKPGAVKREDVSRLTPGEKRQLRAAKISQKRAERAAGKGGGGEGELLDLQWLHDRLVAAAAAADAAGDGGTLYAPPLTAHGRKAVTRLARLHCYSATESGSGKRRALRLEPVRGSDGVRRLPDAGQRAAAAELLDEWRRTASGAAAEDLAKLSAVRRGEEERARRERRKERRAAEREAEGGGGSVGPPAAARPLRRKPVTLSATFVAAQGAAAEAASGGSGSNDDDDDDSDDDDSSNSDASDSDSSNGSDGTSGGSGADIAAFGRMSLGGGAASGVSAPLPTVPLAQPADAHRGEWEAHTTGFGSRMLASFGYAGGQLGSAQGHVTRSLLGTGAAAVAPTGAAAAQPAPGAPSAQVARSMPAPLEAEPRPSRLGLGAL